MSLIVSADKKGLQPVNILGYYEDMHIFEMMDWTEPQLNSASDLRLQFQIRQQRLLNCTHD